MIFGRKKIEKKTLHCLTCKKEIVGTSENEVLHNLRVHLLTHKKKTKNENN